MNRITKFFHEVLHPHCEHCREEQLEKISDSFCKSCEILKEQLAFSNHEKTQLLNRLLEKPEKEVIQQSPEITRPRNIPWHVRRQILEKEDREKARIMREAPKPLDLNKNEETASVEEFEKELDSATATREAEAKS